MTGHKISPAALEQAKSGGAVGWLVKPCRPEQLLAVSKRILAKRSTSTNGD